MKTMKIKSMLMLLLAGSVLTACHKDDDYPTLYTITVTSDNDAQGDAEANRETAEAGETITLTADPNAGYLFDRWVASNGVELDDELANPETFVMPGGNVTVTAHFKVDPTEIRNQLETAIELAEGLDLNEEDYTESSWADYQDALDHAKEVAADDGATTEQIQEALQDLNDAYENLI